MASPKLTSNIFTFLESKFLFPDTKPVLGKVRILSIDSSNALLAAASLAHLESSLRRHYPNLSLSNFFDLAAGSGAGAILVSLLFTRDKENHPIFSANDALRFFIKNKKRVFDSPGNGFFRKVFKREPSRELKEVFGETTLKETCKPVLIPCYDLTTGRPFVFSRADALEMDGCDFRIKDVCAATMAGKGMEIRSVDGIKRIVAVGGDVCMSNPTAAAITHVLNNKHEFPLCNGVEDLLVVSLGSGDSGNCTGNVTPSRSRGYVHIAGEGASDLVDQAVSMAFSEHRTTNYFRVQANQPTKKTNNADLLETVKEMMAQKNLESVLFQGKSLAHSSNLEKLQKVAGELIKEQERRKTCMLPTVVLKQGSPSPRSSSATSLSTLSSN